MTTQCKQVRKNSGGGACKDFTCYLPVAHFFNKRESRFITHQNKKENKASQILNKILSMSCETIGSRKVSRAEYVH